MFRHAETLVQGAEVGSDVPLFVVIDIVFVEAFLDADTQELRDFLRRQAAEDAGGHCAVEKAFGTQIADMPREFYPINHLGCGAEPHAASATVAAASFRRRFNGVPCVLPRNGFALGTLVAVLRSSFHPRALRRVHESQRPNILAAHMHSRILSVVARHEVLALVPLLDHVERGPIDNH